MHIILSLCEARQSMGKLTWPGLSPWADAGGEDCCQISNIRPQIDLFEPKKPFGTFVPHLAVSFG